MTDLITIYACLCDKTRLRILNLLLKGPLCVCHFQSILGKPQVAISKHLKYLKNHALVESSRNANWVIYMLPKKQSALLEKNLACLQDCVKEDGQLSKDVQKMSIITSRSTCGLSPKQAVTKIKNKSTACCL